MFRSYDQLRRAHHY